VPLWYYRKSFLLRSSCRRSRTLEFTRCNTHIGLSFVTPGLRGRFSVFFSVASNTSVTAQMREPEHGKKHVSITKTRNETSQSPVERTLTRAKVTRGKKKRKTAKGDEEYGGDERDEDLSWFTAGECASPRQGAKWCQVAARSVAPRRVVCNASRGSWIPNSPFQSPSESKGKSRDASRFGLCWFCHMKTLREIFAPFAISPKFSYSLFAHRALLLANRITLDSTIFLICLNQIQR